MLQAEGVDGQHVGALGLQAAYQGVNGQQVAAHPVGAVEQDADAGPFSLELLGYEGVHVHAVSGVGVVDALPRQRSRGFVAVGGAEVGVAEEQEQVLEVLNAALHQVGEDGIHLHRGNGAGGDQVLVPFLVAGAGDEGYALAAAVAHQRVESIRHGPFSAQQPQRHDAGVGREGHNLTISSPSLRERVTLSSLSPWERVRVRVVGRIDGVNAREAGRQRRQGAVCRQDVGIGGGYEQDGLLLLHSSAYGGRPHPNPPPEGEGIVQGCRR